MSVELNAGSGGATVAADEIAGEQFQVVKIDVGADGVSAPLGNSNPIPVSDAGGTLTVDGTVAVTNAGLTELAAAINASSQMDVNIAASGATVPVSNAGLTELAAAINASSQMDVNIAASGATVPVSNAALTELAAAINSSKLDVNVASYAAQQIDDAAFTPATDPIAMVGATFDDASPDSVNEGDGGALRMSANRSLYVNIRDNAGNERGLNIDAAGALAVASHAVTNAGTFAVQVDGAALTALQLIDNSSIADDTAFTPTTTGVNMAGFVADEGSTDSVDEGDGGAARMTLDRKQIMTPYAHAAAGGASPYKSLDLDESEEEVKATPGKVFWVHAINLAATKRYLKFYNDTAANVSVGTTVPVLTFPIPTLATTDGAGFTISFGDIGVQFSAAICIAATTGFADNDTGAPGANEVIVNLGWL